jgi:hypothetical protein
MVISASRSPRGSRPTIEGPGFLARADLQVLFDLLREDGRRLIGRAAGVTSSRRAAIGSAGAAMNGSSATWWGPRRGRSGPSRP